MIDLAIAVLTIGLMEVGDKTMLATISFALARRKYLRAFLISVTGFALASAVAVLVTSLLDTFVGSSRILSIAAGVLFLIIGILILREKNNDDESGHGSNTASATFLGAVTLAELGDKTEIAILGLAITYSPAVVFVGAIIGYALVQACALYIVKRVARRIKSDLLKKGAALLMIGLGIIYIVMGALA
jgi:putative Ca2+/H+ antiporter (TMEM165/GDT1 family)